MMPVVLLSGSFVRQNRWLLLAFAAWPFLMGLFFWSPHHAANREDVIGLLQQEVFYGIAVVGFLASSALYNEKRSRRIVGVLSKNVSRAQYLLGFLVGAGVFAFGYFVAVGTSSLWLLGHSEAIVKAALAIIVRGVTASVWIASLALLFSTFLYPFIAAAVAGAAAFLPLALAHRSNILAPVGSLFAGSDLLSPTIIWPVVGISLFECAIFLLVGAQIFAHRDVTVSLE
jgi:hypothetical protein